MIHIITVNWNTPKQTISFINSLNKQVYKDFRIYLVNNSPSDSEKFNIFKKTRNVIVINNNKNIGYSGGINTGIKKAISFIEENHLDLENQWLLITNNDVSYTRDFLLKLSKIKSSRSVYSPVIKYNGTNLVQNTGGKISLLLGGCVNLNKKRDIKNIRKVTPDFLSGCVMYVNLKTWLDVGFFDEEYGSYYEDVDWSIRAKKKGYKLSILYDIYIDHIHSLSTNKNSKRKLELIHRNSIIFAKKQIDNPLKRYVFLINHYIMYTLRKVYFLWRKE